MISEFFRMYLIGWFGHFVYVRCAKPTSFHLSYTLSILISKAMCQGFTIIFTNNKCVPHCICNRQVWRYFSVRASHLIWIFLEVVTFTMMSLWCFEIYWIWSTLIKGGKTREAKNWSKIISMPTIGLCTSSQFT